MSLKTLNLDDRLYRYVLDVSLREHPVLARLRERTATDPMAEMQISPEQGQFMALAARLLNVRSYLEIGVFTGYSSLAVALAMPADSVHIALDVSKEWTDIARQYWDEAGVGQRIELRLKPALETLEELLAEEMAGHFDLAFIDADKGNYLAYYERVLELMRPGGLVMVDNTLWSGSVADPAKTSDDTNAIRQFNKFVHTDDRVDISLLPIGDGLTLARKREARARD